ncbi:hypothetical protein [Natrinema limicola]|uniref:Uncharacterized protein n=1 Tax=Natrinema limicola JCM 13563 TaxID=1230457 RepID=M0CD70_9EURY|nr:hypothetical protein [Natrinema limicola]ELZ21226.1 hypothetical protein C476_08653 [Natrinema limicola JCM 13563]
MNVYKALFGITSVALGVLALLGSGVFSARDRQESAESAHESAHSETVATVQFDHDDATTTREPSRSRTHRESAKRHVDPIFRTP